MKKCLTLLLAFFLTALAAGCGKREEQTPAVSYEVTSLPVSLGELIQGEVILTQDAVYHLEENDGYRCIVKRTFGELADSPEATGKTVIVFTDGEMPETFQRTEEGLFYCTITGKPADGEAAVSHFLRKYDADGKLLWEKEIPGLDEVFLKQLLLEGDTIYALGQSTVSILDEEGKLLHQAELNCDLTDGAGLADGKLLVLCSTQDKTELVILDETLQEIERKTVERAQYLPACEQGLYLKKGENVVRQGQETAETLFDLTKYQLDAYALSAVHSVKNGYVLLAGLADTELIFLTTEGMTWERAELPEQSAEDGQEQMAEASSEEMIPDEEKEQLLLAVLNYQMYSGDITLFNKASRTYHMNVKRYEDFSQYDIQLGASMTAKDAPDLIELTGGSVNTAYHSYIRNGYLEELTPFLNADGDLQQADFVEAVLEQQTVDGGLYTIPTGFTLQCLAVSSSLLEGKTSWSIGEFLDFLEKYPDACTLSGISAAENKTSILQLALQGGLTEFIDFTTGTAALDSVEFRTLLERIQGLKISDRMSPSEGEPVVWFVSLSKPRDLQQLEWKNGEEVTLIGYPGADGGNILMASKRLAINSNSGQKEGAWQFMKYLLTQQPAVEKMTEFSVRKDLLEEYLYAEAKPVWQTDEEGNYVLDENGKKVEIYSTFDGIPYFAITEEQIQKIRGAIDTGFMIDEATQTIYTEVCEEAKPYFQGQKSLDDVVKVMQSRVQIYLDERK